MRVLVAGASGVIGRRLVPLLGAVGHEVIGLSRSRAGAAQIEAAGGRLVKADALDRAEVISVVQQAEPDVIVNMLTAIPAAINPRTLARDFALTNRLRTVGTRNLVEAAPGVRMISQGIAYVYDPAGGPHTQPANEDAPIWRAAPKQWATTLAALLELERLTATTPHGLVTRFGQLYGPGSLYAVDGSITRQVRAGKMPIVGNGGSVFSFTHAVDAASAIVAALDRDVSGALNIVDDRPTPIEQWLPEFAAMLKAPAPKRVPTVLARLAVGGWGVAFMTQLRGADNARARLALDWQPRYGDWRAGFATELATAPGDADRVQA